MNNPLLPSLEQDVKTFLREMPVVREYVREAFTAHHLHGETIRQAIGFVGTRAVQCQSLQKEGARVRYDVHIGIRK